MANIAIKRLTNANIYLGGNSLLGRAESFELPSVTALMAEHKALGLMGAVEYPSGIDKMKSKIKWNSFYSDVMKKFANPYEALKLQARGNLETFSGGSRTAQTPFVVYMTALSTDFPLGSFQPHENVEAESNLSVYYCKLEIGGEEIIEFDAEANIYKVNGEDILAQYRANIGG